MNDVDKMHVILLSNSYMSIGNINWFVVDIFYLQQNLIQKRCYKQAHQKEITQVFT